MSLSFSIDHLKWTHRLLWRQWERVTVAGEMGEKRPIFELTLRLPRTIPTQISPSIKNWTLSGFLTLPLEVNKQRDILRDYCFKPLSIVDGKINTTSPPRNSCRQHDTWSLSVGSLLEETYVVMWKFHEGWKIEMPSTLWRVEVKRKRLLQCRDWNPCMRMDVLCLPWSKKKPWENRTLQKKSRIKSWMITVELLNGNLRVYFRRFQKCIFSYDY